MWQLDLWDLRAFIDSTQIIAKDSNIMGERSLTSAPPVHHRPTETR